MKNKIFAFFSVKELLGKTTLCLILSLLLIKYNKKILLIDFNPKQNLTKFFIKSTRIDNIYKYLNDKKDLKTIINKNVFNNIDLITSNLDSCYLINSQWNDQYYNQLKLLFDKLVLEYDYIFVDLSSIKNQQNEIILSLVQAIIWISNSTKTTNLEINDGLKYLTKIKKIFNKNITINGIIINFFNNKQTLMVKYYSEIVKIFYDGLYNTTIKNDNVLTNLKTVYEINNWLNKSNKLNELKLLVDEFLFKNEEQNE